MLYYRLLSDMEITDQWHLGDVTFGGNNLKVAIDTLSFLEVSSVDVELSTQGRALEFSMTTFGVPVACLADAVESCAGLEVQRLPANLLGHEGYSILHALRLVECLDESRSTFLKWLPGDHRTDLVGQFRMVTSLRLNAREIPEDANFFRVKRWPVALIVSAVLRERMQRTGCRGARFQEV